MMEIIIRLEQNEVGRLFTTLGGGLVQLMGQRAGANLLDPDVDVDAAGRIRGGTTRIHMDRRPNMITSVADILDLMSRMQSDQGPLFPPADGECQHRYAFLHTEQGNDIYVCQRDGCDKRLTIPGQIVVPAPIEETTEVEEDETRSRDEDSRHERPLGLPPGESEEVVGEDPPS